MKTFCMGYFLLWAIPLFAIESESTTQLSKSLGHLIGKNLQSMKSNVDIDALIRGLLDEMQGENLALDEDTCVKAFDELQKRCLAEKAKQNELEATLFLQNNAKVSGIIVSENGKLQYKINRIGAGNPVHDYNSPLVHYTIHYLDGKPYSTSANDERLNFDSVMEGIKKGVVGMREKEMRTLYIHPDLAYGHSTMAKPNALLVVEIEVIQAELPPSTP